MAETVETPEHSADAGFYSIDEDTEVYTDYGADLKVCMAYYSV
jgi:hypothetical protein